MLSLVDNCSFHGAERSPRQLHFDRAGKPMALMDWAAAFEDFPGRQIGDTMIDGVRVSTVWIGIAARKSIVGNCRF